MNKALTILTFLGIMALQSIFAQSTGKPHRLKAGFGRGFALGPTEVRGEQHARSPLEAPIDGGQDGPDARVLGDAAGIVLRHVEVGADEDALIAGAAVGAEVGESDDVHGVGRSGK